MSVPLPHPRDGSRVIHSAEVLEAQYEENLDCAGLEREAGLMVTAAHAIYSLRQLEAKIAQHEAWERYAMARMTAMARNQPDAVDEEQVQESPHYRDNAA